MNVSVGLIEGIPDVKVELTGPFTDSSRNSYLPGRHRYTSELVLTPSDPAFCAFTLDDMTIGIGFHWQRKERQTFRGVLRIVKGAAGFTVINDVPLDEYITSVISSEMSASCPLELLKAHAVISRSWLRFQKENPPHSTPARSENADPRVIVRWYGREAHADFDVCADDHCQRYQGITKAFSSEAAEAVRATAGEFLRYDGAVCDARFCKSCGGITEQYATAWENKDLPYLRSIHDGPVQVRASDPETWIRSHPSAYCNTDDAQLLARVLPGFDQETRDFYRWRVEHHREELTALIRTKLGIELGAIRSLEPLARGPSGRICRLKIVGERDYVIIGKELEIRRALSPTHLYSSAFVVDRKSDRFILRGAGWGHGVGLCQIGAAVMALAGKTYLEILQHYYRGTSLGI